MRTCVRVRVHERAAGTGNSLTAGVDSCCVSTPERDSVLGPKWRGVLVPRLSLSEKCVYRLGYLLWVSATGGKSPASLGKINKQNELFWIKCRTASVEV